MRPTGSRTEATYDDLGRLITRTLVERRPAAAAYTTKFAYTEAGFPAITYRKADLVHHQPGRRGHQGDRRARV